MPTDISNRRSRRRLGATLVASLLAGSLAGCGVPTYLDEARRDIGVDAQLLSNPTSGCPSPSSFERPPGDGKKVALTFDDGPTPGTTEQILAILAEEGVNATFFDLGWFARQYPDLQRMVSEAGNTVGVHAWDHTDLTTLAPAEIHEQFERAAREVVRNTGEPVCFVRPPYGRTSTAVRHEAFQLGFSEALWNIDSRDWVNPGAETITKEATHVLDSGPVNVLMHAALPEAADGSDAPLTQTVASLRPVIRWYKRMGYEFVQVDGTPFTARTAVTAAGG